MEAIVFLPCECCSNVWNTQRVINTGCSMEAYSRSSQMITYVRFPFTLPIHKGFPRFPTFFEERRRRGVTRTCARSSLSWWADALGYRREWRR